MSDAPAPPAPEHDLPAGPFAAWLAEFEQALDGAAAVDVPCGTCTACCTSSQFVHIDPEETDTLAHIPAALLFPAPLLPDGHVLLGYDERGRCPMLGGDGCSIYAHRPRTCRTYDCRVLAAAGIELDEDEGSKVALARQVRRWQFAFPAAQDRLRHEAVRAAARHVSEHPDDVADRPVRVGSAEHAVVAVEAHRLFLREPSPKRR